MRKLIETCPTCDSAKLSITEVTCDACGTQVRSRYSRCPFCSLTEDQQTFLLLFVRSRGNLKDLEKTLGVSYPTVRAKLDEIVERLAPPALTPAPAPDKCAGNPARPTPSGAGQGSSRRAFTRRGAGLAQPRTKTLSNHLGGRSRPSQVDKIETAAARSGPARASE